YARLWWYDGHRAEIVATVGSRDRARRAQRDHDGRTGKPVGHHLGVRAVGFQDRAGGGDRRVGMVLLVRPGQCAGPGEPGVDALDVSDGLRHHPRCDGCRLRCRFVRVETSRARQGDRGRAARRSPDGVWRAHRLRVQHRRLLRRYRLVQPARLALDDRRDPGDVSRVEGPAVVRRECRAGDYRRSAARSESSTAGSSMVEGTGSSRPSAMARMFLRNTFPERVLGSASTTTASRNAATAPMSLRTVSTSSALSVSSLMSTPDLRTAKPFGTCPLSGSATPTTAHSATAGWAATTASIDPVESRWPATLITSSVRPITNRYPS